MTHTDPGRVSDRAPEHAPDRAEAHHRVTDVLRCKWTLAVLSELDAGAHRPSEIRRSLAGLSDKVLHDRLRKLEAYGLLSKTAFAETPPRVEYALTPRGTQIAELARHVNRFVDDWVGE